MIKKYSLLALQKAINHALALDDNVPAKLTVLHGKVIEVIIAPLGVNFFILFEEQQLKLLSKWDKQPDTIIHSSPLGLIRLSLLPTSQARSLFNNKIRVSGDIELGQSIKQLFDELDIDWEGHLAHFTGDVVAYQLGSLFKRSLAFQRQFGDSIRYNLTDYLQEECRLFPTCEEVNDFCHDVDQLVMDFERLQVKARLLMAIHGID